MRLNEGGFLVVVMVDVTALYTQAPNKAEKGVDGIGMRGKVIRENYGGGLDEV